MLLVCYVILKSKCVFNENYSISMTKKNNSGSCSQVTSSYKLPIGKTLSCIAYYDTYILKFWHNSTALGHGFNIPEIFERQRHDMQAIRKLIFMVMVRDYVVCVIIL